MSKAPLDLLVTTTYSSASVLGTCPSKLILDMINPAPDATLVDFADGALTSFAFWASSCCDGRFVADVAGAVVAADDGDTLTSAGGGGGGVDAVISSTTEEADLVEGVVGLFTSSTEKASVDAIARSRVKINELNLKLAMVC